MAKQPDSHPQDLEKQLAALLRHFDSEEKDELAEKLVEDFQLDESAKFAPQISQKLGRPLTPGELFKLNVLFQALAFHNEESEEEEE